MDIQFLKLSAAKITLQTELANLKGELQNLKSELHREHKTGLLEEQCTDLTQQLKLYKELVANIMAPPEVMETVRLKTVPVIIPDTNAFLHNLDFLENVSKLKVIFRVPVAVVNEIDVKQYGRNKRNKAARKFIVKNCLMQRNINFDRDWSSIPDEIKKSKNAANDASIYNYCKHLELAHRTVCVITSDKMLTKRLHDNVSKAFNPTDTIDNFINYMDLTQPAINT